MTFEERFAAHILEKSKVDVPNEMLDDVLDIMEVFSVMKKKARRRVVAYANEIVLIDEYRKVKPADDD